MAMPKNIFPSMRVRLDYNLKMRSKGETLDPRQQVFHDWYLENSGRAATLAAEMITSMLNGEMGPQLQAAVQTGDTQAAIEAAQDLFAAFVVE